MARKLIRLDIDEVSGVVAAANKRSFLIRKSAAPEKKESQKMKITEKLAKAFSDFFIKQMGAEEEEGASTFSEELLERKMGEIMGDLSDHVGALYESVRSILGSAETDKPGLISQSIADFSKCLVDCVSEWLMADMGTEGVAKIGAKMTADRLKRMKEVHAAMGNIISEVGKDEQTKNADQKAKTEKRRIDMLQVEKEKLPKELREEVNKMEADAIKMTVRIAELETAKPADKGDGGEDPILKNASPELKAAILKERAEKADLQKELKDTKDVTATEKFVAIAKKDMRGLTGKPEDLGKILKSVKDKSPEDYPELERILKAAAETIRQSKMFVEMGAGGADGGEAVDKMNALVIEEIKKDAKLDRAAAMAKVAEAHPDIYAEYSKSVQVKI